MKVPTLHQVNFEIIFFKFENYQNLLFKGFADFFFF